MHAAVIDAEPKPKQRRRPIDRKESVPCIPDVMVKFRTAIGEAVVRAVWLEDLTSSHIARTLTGFRSSDLALLKSGDILKFGPNRLMTLAAILKCKVRYDVIPPAAPARAPDDRVGLLFRALEETDDACQAAYETIGPRSYPLTRVVVRQAGTQCALAIDAIRRGPEFWHREALLFSAMLFSSEQMLESMTSKSPQVCKAIVLLRNTATMMEEIADEIGG